MMVYLTSFKQEVGQLSCRSLLLFFFVLVEVAYFLVSYSLIDESILIDTYLKQVAYERAVDLVDRQMSMQWVNYVFLPCIYSLVFFCVVMVVSGGLILFDVKFSIRSVLKATILAEFVNFIPMIMKVIWFGLIHRTYSMEDLQSFAPLSLSSIVEVSEYPAYLFSLIQTSSLFWVGYILLLAFFLSKFLENAFSNMLMVVVASYGSVWVIMQVFTVFILISFS
ncbi:MULTISPECIES: hypothetical protein [unclassified Imperialibacter]|uniref:hypothetical protein n=1 Tax=unclassified Imperialibacter TaxID=2629706 RepID=UPI001256CE18|nr:MULTISPECIES: hypothetical protein [unclassified Imperialibacter]CAD5255216.1 conserved membrane hypothetical protein [Imperialibacter sp. 75]CAD5263776.1 conserved membrane hypothetical protein [Imperialibacter sp. 89]VVT35504.1 conserved membrane hypothetical protein [Imperialibacter sp. EC-SDR9]